MLNLHVRLCRAGALTQLMEVGALTPPVQAGARAGLSLEHKPQSLIGGPKITSLRGQSRTLGVKPIKLLNRSCLEYSISHHFEEFSGKGGGVLPYR